MLGEITVSMVKSFKISDSCLDTYPCSHECTIKLIDNREKKAYINGDNIQILIQEIAANNITITGDHRHFEEFRNKKKFKRTDSELDSELDNEIPIPDEILTNIFKK